MKKLLLICMLIGWGVTAQAQTKKTVLWNKAGKKVAYITPGNALHLYKNQQQVAYLIVSNAPDVLDVYDVNGNHLGFFREGILYNRQKYIAAFVPEALEKLELAVRSDKAIKSVLMDLQIYGWVSIERFLRGVED
ncbi:4-fold beta flower protein [Microscilla marina]|uniref:4-fold beta flower domain-containing protein n=1 Tax=Microscilla marina ATCC 23134 TaxID=313606 RepID=A1ZSB6_MICM2|nr:hypothetical protein [Microscilla marina]EAY26664.1 hypothetical protein M23134_02915 [Microscilla marina ATCC 23134]